MILRVSVNIGLVADFGEKLPAGWRAVRVPYEIRG
jgi:hypothetical protein